MVRLDKEIKKAKNYKPKKEYKTPQEISDKAMKILKDPKLFQKIYLSELDKKIVGEEEGRKVIVLCAYGGRTVENCQTASYNIMVNDDAGTGKDYMTGASLEMLPKQFYIKKTRISPTVLNYWKSDDPLWTWDGKVLYLEDISEGILNHDVFKVMCSSGTSATIVKDQKVIDLEVEGKPVMIITTATATPNPELTRRFVILNLDSSKDQTKEIMKRHSKFREQGIIPVVNQDYRHAMQFLKRVKVKIPFANDIHEHFPHNNIIMRTHYPRFLDFISASTGFHQFQRKKEGEFIIAEGQDYDLARECFLKLCSNKYMIPLTINQKKILEVFEKDPNLEGTIPELHANYINFISDKALRYNLSLLSSYGIFKSESKINMQNKTVESYSLAKNYKPNEKIEIPTFKMIRGREGREAGNRPKNSKKNEDLCVNAKKTTSEPISKKEPKSTCQSTSEPSEPSLPTFTSEPSLPNNKNNNNGNKNDFLDDEVKQIMEEFHK